MPNSCAVVEVYASMYFLKRSHNLEDSKTQEKMNQDGHFLQNVNKNTSRQR